MTEALGLIEVIGYPPAVEAADSALKAANVKLGSITKVDGGIMTVQIFGDVGAVKAAVDAAGIAAARVGEVRATHVIPRLAPALSRVFFENESKKPVKTQLISEEYQPTSHVVEKDIFQPSQTIGTDKADIGIEHITQVVPGYDTVSDTGPVVVEKLSPTELTKLSNTELKNLIASLGIKVAPRKLKSAKKEELINMIIQFYKEGEN
ncbi:MAG: BMC domain-containing protein [Cellulosilyticaceae bacterium]